MDPILDRFREDPVVSNFAASERFIVRLKLQVVEFRMNTEKLKHTQNSVNFFYSYNCTYMH